LSDLIDRESNGRMAVAVMPSSSPHRSARDADIEREYGEHRSAVLAMLRADFPRLRDIEEIYQEAWVDLLELEGRGETPVSRRALLRKIAWRRAADTVKRRRPDTLDPLSAAMTAATDDGLLPDEQAQLRLDGDALRLVVESLDEQQASVLKLRFDLHFSVREIQGQLGLSEKRVEAIITEAYKRVAAQLAVGEDGETHWSKRQRSLLVACELGVASARQRRHAQAMLNRDPTCLAMLRAVRSSLSEIGAVLPLPILIEDRDRLGAMGRATGRLDEVWAAVRHFSDRLTGRGVGSANVIEQAGVTGASAGAGAAAVKVLTACLALGGTTAVCVVGTNQLREHPAGAQAAAPSTRRVVEPARDHVAVVRLPTTRTATHSKVRAASAHHETPVSSPKSRPSVSPAPKGSTEFGPGTLGSTAAPTQPATAPQNGGGEFGP
jgi:RNA polymerase sigma factor (sigma-70 family)